MILEEIRQAYRVNGMPEDRLPVLEFILTKYWDIIQEETRAEITCPMRFGKIELLFLTAATSGYDRIPEGFHSDFSKVMSHIGYEVYIVRKYRSRQKIEYGVRRSRKKSKKPTCPKLSSVVNTDLEFQSEEGKSSHFVFTDASASDTSMPPVTNNPDTAGYQVPLPSDNTAFAPISIPAWPNTVDDSPAHLPLPLPNDETASNNNTIPLNGYNLDPLLSTSQFLMCM